MVNEQCFSLAIEKLLNIDVPLRAKYIRGRANYQLTNDLAFLNHLKTKLLEWKGTDEVWLRVTDSLLVTIFWIIF